MTGPSETSPVAVPLRSRQTLLLAIALIRLACHRVDSPRTLFAIDGRESTAYPTWVILDQLAIAHFNDG